MREREKEEKRGGGGVANSMIVKNFISFIFKQGANFVI